MTAPKVRADATARADRAWNARLLGASWEAAAQVAGFANSQNAMRAVRRHYGRMPEADRGELRTLWRERLEVLWRQASRDALEQQPGAVTAAVRVAQAACRLDGLDEPTRTEVHVTEHIEALILELTRHDL